MSALPPQNRCTPSQDLLDLRDYVALEQAAAILGVHRGHLARLCSAELQRRGLAVLAKPANCGHARWHVRRDYDRRLQGEPARHDFDACELERFTGKQRRLALMRAQCVDRFRDVLVNRPGHVRDWLPGLLANLAEQHPELGGVSRASLYGWAKVYRGPADLEQLIDTRGGDVKGKGDPAAWSYFESIYLDQRKPSLRSCFERTQAKAAAEGWRWCSEPSCRRQLDDRIPEARQLRMRDPGKYRVKYEPFIKQDAERFAAGRCWVGDHAQLDFWCLAGKSVARVFATTWMDWRTRKIVGWVLSPEPNSSTILAAFRMGMLDEANQGGPSEVIVDNGRDYDAWFWDGQTKRQRLSKTKVLEAGHVDEAQFSGIFGLLKIEPHYSIAYCPNGKSPQERWYRTLHERFDKSFPTYCGSKPEDKPEALEQVLRERRNIPAFAHVYERFTAFVKGYNADADHQMEGLLDGGERISPNEAMRRWCTTRRVFAPGVLDLALQQWHRPVTVGRNGVTIGIVGQTLSYGQFEPALIPYKGKKHHVFVSFDPHRLQTVRVYDDKLRFIATAALNGVGGMPAAGQADIARRHVRQQLAARREYDRAVRMVAAHPELEFLTKQELIAEAADTVLTPDPQRPLKLIQTPLDGQGKALQRGHYRQAAGGEHDATPALPPLSELRDHLASAALPRVGVDDDDLDIWDSYREGRL